MKEIMIDEKYHEFVEYLAGVTKQPVFIQGEFWRNLESVIRAMSKQEQITLGNNLNKLIRQIYPEGLN